MPQKACRGAAAPLGVWEQGPEQGLSTESLSGESFLLNLASVCPLLAGPQPVHTPPTPPPGRRVLSKAQGLSIMVQEEVAERFCAKENTPEYGSITAAIALDRKSVV